MKITFAIVGALLALSALNGAAINSINSRVSRDLDLKGFVQRPKTQLTPPARAQSRGMEGDVIYPPYFENFDRDNALDGYTIINVDNDRRSWRLNEGRAAIPTYNLYEPEVANNDWLILPPISVEEGKTYRISFIAGGNSADIEKISLYYGVDATPAALDHCLIPETDIVTYWDKYVTMQAEFTAENTEEVFLGFFCNSPATSWLWIDNLAIEAGYSQSSPAECGMTVKGINDTKKAAISVTAPTQAVNGSALSGTMTIEVVRDHEKTLTKEGVKPGEKVEFEDGFGSAGVHSYHTAALIDGNYGRPSSEQYLYVGVEKPLLPINMVGKESKPGSLTYTWDPNPNGVSGYPINTERFTYRITDLDKNVLVDNLTEPTYTFEFPETEGTTNSYVLKVKTSAGWSDEAMLPVVPVGKVYDLPIAESFTNAQAHYPIGFYIPGRRSAWAIQSDTTMSDMKSFDLDNGYLGCIQVADEVSSVVFPKMKIPNSGQPSLSFNLYSHPDKVSNTITVTVVTPEGRTDILSGPIYDVCNYNAGWNLKSCSLEQFKGKTAYIEVSLTKPIYMWSFMDNFLIADSKKVDLKVNGIELPEQMKIDTPTSVTVNLYNAGYETSLKPATLTLYCNGRQVGQQAVDSIAPGVVKAVPFDVTLTILDSPEGVFYATVECEQDENPDNNTSEQFISPIVFPDYPSVVLEGQAQDGTATLSWNEPSLAWEPEVVTESFEEYQPWSQTFGDWTTYDLDKEIIANIAQWPIIDVPCSWFVMNKADYPRTAVAHTGNLGLTTWYTKNGENNDWVLTPILSGNKQTISFFAAKPQTYDEKLSLYTSTKSNKPDDFTFVQTITDVDKEWKEYQVEVPAGTLYLAFRYHSKNEYGMLLDDITYETAPSAAHLTFLGYNLYRDGQKVNEEPMQQREFTDTNIGEGHAYQVTALYDHAVFGKVESAPSNTLRLPESSIGNVSGSKVYETGRYDLMGIRADKNQKGMMIIRYSDGSARKVMVR